MNDPGIPQMDEPTRHRQQEPAMHKRRITLSDGRPMIFYTFGAPDPLTAEENSDRPYDAGAQPGKEDHV